MKRVKPGHSQTRVCKWCGASRVWRTGGGLFPTYACDKHVAELAKHEAARIQNKTSEADQETWMRL